MSKIKFDGTFQELQDKVLLTGMYGEWEDNGNHKLYKAETGAILNWWESSKTVHFQGNKKAAAQFESLFNGVNIKLIG